MTVYFMNDQYMKESEVTVSVHDRGYYFGDGIYEVIKVYDGKLFTEKEHIARLMDSANKVKMKLPYTPEQFITIAQTLVEKNELRTGHVYIQITRGVAPRVHHFPLASVTPVVMAYAIENPRPVEMMTKGVRVKVVEDIRWLRCDIKSLNLLGNVLAKQEAHEAGCTEALLVRDGIVREGSSSNMFGVKNGIVYTHPANQFILNGITRQVVLQLCEQHSIEVREQSFDLEEALQMEEFFLTSTTAEITPVIAIDEQKIGAGTPGPITQQLQQAFLDLLPHTVQHL